MWFVPSGRGWLVVQIPAAALFYVCEFLADVLNCLSDDFLSGFVFRCSFSIHQTQNPVNSFPIRNHLSMCDLEQYFTGEMKTVDSFSLKFKMHSVHSTNLTWLCDGVAKWYARHCPHPMNKPVMIMKMDTKLPDKLLRLMSLFSFILC